MTSIHKVRRDVRGGKRGDGDSRHKRIRRADPTRIHRGHDDATLTGVAGLASFGSFCRRKGIDAELRRLFFRLKSSVMVVYPMEAQLRLLLDANIVGEARVFGLESLAADPLFVRLAGGVVPSIDTVYRDLCRFDDAAVADLEMMMAEQGLASVHEVKTKAVHLDVDTTVECVFGSQEGALPGPNPRYHARASYHPILVYCAEAGTCVGALLRPGDTGLGDADAPTIGRWIRRFRIAAGGDVQVTMRIDAGGDCAAIYAAAHRAGARFIGKAKLSATCAAPFNARPSGGPSNGMPSDSPRLKSPRSASRATHGRSSDTRFASLRCAPASATTASRSSSGPTSTIRSRPSSQRLDGRCRGHRLRVRRPCGSRAGDRRAQVGLGNRKDPQPRLSRQSRRLPAEAARAQSHAPLRPLDRTTSIDLARPVAATRPHQPPRASPSLGSALDTPRASEVEPPPRLTPAPAS